MPIVNVQIFEGRDEGKPAMAKAITEAIVEHGGVDPQYVYVVFEDVKTSDWAIGGDIFSNISKT